MGNSTSAEKSLTQEQKDIRYLGDRMPFGDAELRRLCRCYTAVEQQLLSPHERALLDAMQRDDTPDVLGLAHTIDGVHGERIFEAGLALGDGLDIGGGLGVGGDDNGIACGDDGVGRGPDLR